MSRKKLKEVLRRPDQFVQIFGELTKDIVTNWKKVVIVVAGVFVLLGAFLVWQNEVKKENLVAANAFQALEEEMPGGTLKEEDSAKENPWQDWAKKVEAFLQEHGDTAMAPTAHLYLGKAYLRLGNYEQAISSYEQAENRLSRPYRYLAMEGLANAYVALKNWTKAEGIWKELMDAKDNPIRDLHAWRLGLTQEWANQKSKALQTYQAFEQEFTDSSILEKVRERISAIQTEVSS